MQLSENFQLEEFLLSQTAVRNHIDNTPSTEIISSLAQLCLNILEPIRAHFGKDIKISSGYRSPSVNQAVGGAVNSQHMFGEAADFNIPGVTIDEVVMWIAESDLPFDQVINEFGRWTHVSCTSRWEPRRQVLKFV